jgi:carbon-monoxide dehydrogenase small subunit
MLIEMVVNGQKVSVNAGKDQTLLDLLREKMLLTGTKKGCENGECGACTVLVDGKPVNSCLYPAPRAEGKNITTIEGLGTSWHLHPVQEAFVEVGALQCGYCGPGLILTTKALLDRHPDPSEDQIRRGISGNICRCSGYVKIIEAIKLAAVKLRREGDAAGDDECGW